MQKKKIEAIYPLTFMQKALLFHRLHETNDQGFLQVQCTLAGSLDHTLLQEAWKKVVQRHAILRTSIHWKDMEKPLQVTLPEGNPILSFHDWTTTAPAQLPRKWAAFKQADHEEGIDISKVPAWRLAVVRWQPETFRLLWSCHHILLDGWSAALILQDVFSIYDALCRGIPPDMETVPNYRTYFNWLQRQDLSGAESFWKKTLEGFRLPGLPALSGYTTGKKQVRIEDHIYTLPEADTLRLQEDARRCQVTLNTYVQGIWALLLGRFQNRDDVVFGATVSGRSAPVPHLEKMAGMFMNVLPVRVKMDGGSSFTDCLKALQKQQMEARNYEQASMDQILSWSGWPGYQPLFDSLLVVENFPWNDRVSGALRVQDLTGGLTTTYPLTLIVKPGDRFTFHFKYNPAKIPSTVIEWFCIALEKLIQESFSIPADRLIHIMPSLPTDIPALIPPPSPDEAFLSNTHVAPRNAAELKLTRIWESVLGLQPVGVTENFFALGGTSLLAVRMFAEIEKQTSRNLPPVLLLQNPTVEKLALIMFEEETNVAWSSLVTLRTGGSKPPLFCVHAGGGHVFFYNDLAKHMDPEQPVYAMQPLGMDGVSKEHNSIEEMAAHYLEEIRTVQPEGPVALLGTCLSTAVSHEMAYQLEQQGDSVSLLAMVDAAPEHTEPVFPPSMQDRIQGFKERLKQSPLRAFADMLKHRTAEIRKKWETAKLDKQTRNLQKMQDHLRGLFNTYKWRAHNGKVTFFRCQEFKEAERGDWFIPVWEELAKGGVEVIDVPGHHLTLFEEPEVQEFAKYLQRKLDEENKR